MSQLMYSVPFAPGLRRARVLVVDDHPPMLVALVEALLSDDFDVECTGLGEDALHRVQTGRHDVLIADVCMPDLPGDQLVRQVLQLPHAVGCVLLTAAPERVSESLRGRHDVGAVLSKPYDPAQLVRLVGQLAQLTRLKRTMAELAQPVSR